MVTRGAQQEAGAAGMMQLMQRDSSNGRSTVADAQPQQQQQQSQVREAAMDSDHNPDVRKHALVYAEFHDAFVKFQALHQFAKLVAYMEPAFHAHPDRQLQVDSSTLRQLGLTWSHILERPDTSDLITHASFLLFLNQFKLTWTITQQQTSVLELRLRPAW